MGAKSEKNAENCTFPFGNTIFCNIELANEVDSFSFTSHTHYKLVEELLFAQTSSYTNAYPPRACTHIYTGLLFFAVTSVTSVTK